MKLKLDIGFEQLFNLVKQLPQPEKQRLITALQETSKQNKSQKKERELGKYQDKIQIAENFNAPRDDLKDYM